MGSTRANPIKVVENNGGSFMVTSGITGDSVNNFVSDSAFTGLLHASIETLFFRKCGCLLSRFMVCHKGCGMFFF